MRQEIDIRDLSGLDKAAQDFLSMTEGRKIIAFYAPMGAGKTTFITALCKKLGVKDPVCSPTFTIVNEYATADRETIYHFDFYRISKLSEAMDIGFDDYIYSGNLCLIEWPENISGLLPEETLEVHIDVHPDLSRTIWWEE